MRQRLHEAGLDVLRPASKLEQGRFGIGERLRLFSEHGNQRLELASDGTLTVADLLLFGPQARRLRLVATISLRPSSDSRPSSSMRAFRWRRSCSSSLARLRDS
jgi:hypothetical protein